MLTCLPAAFCAWDYRVLGLSVGPAMLTFTHFGENGGVQIGGVELSVVRHGWMQHSWTLEQQGVVCAEAQKPSAFHRAYEVRSETLDFALRAQSVFGRSFAITVGGEVLGVIRPAHPFTRRAFIECSHEVPEPAQLFAFWLVAISWRRTARRRH